MLKLCADHLPDAGELDFENQDGDLPEFLFALSPAATKQLSVLLDRAVREYLGVKQEN